MFYTLEFWCLFPLCVIAYWLVPGRLRMAFLAAASMAFVAYFAPRNSHAILNVSAVLAWAMAFYYLAPLAVRKRAGAARVAGPAIRQADQGDVATIAGAAASGGSSTATVTQVREPYSPSVGTAGSDRRWILWSLIVGVLGYLVFFKSLLPLLLKARRGAAAIPYTLPLGISYFTFKIIHYGVEVARGNIKDRSLPRFLAYVFLFPTFAIGPIERFDHFLSNRRDQWSADLVVDGASRIIQGVIKKFFLAEMVFGETWGMITSPRLMMRLGGMEATRIWWYGIVAYLYVYLDFAGYTDMAIGAAKLFGLGIMENFDKPFAATNIGSFWKRWHMTLTGWCQSYVYMPVLGLTRKPNLATYASFVVIGLWHSMSAPWLFWGLYHGTGIVVYGAWTRLKRRRKWTFLDLGWRKYAGAAMGIAATTMFIAAGEIVTFGALHSGHDTLRVIAKLAFINIR